MQMTDIIDGMSPYDCPTACNFPGGIYGFGGINSLGCGFGSWIWILLILFYANSNNLVGAANNMGCCHNNSSNACCCNGVNAGYAGCSNGAAAYLFLLVILFLCGSHGNNNAYGNNYGTSPLGGSYVPGYAGDCCGLGAGYESACDYNC